MAAWENDTLRGNFLARFVKQLQPTNNQKTSWKRVFLNFIVLSLGTGLLGSSRSWIDRGLRHRTYDIQDSKTNEVLPGNVALRLDEEK